MSPFNFVLFFVLCSLGDVAEKKDLRFEMRGYVYLFHGAHAMAQALCEIA